MISSTLITSPRSHLQRLPLWGLGLQHMPWGQVGTNILFITSEFFLVVLPVKLQLFASSPLITRKTSFFCLWSDPLLGHFIQSHSESTQSVVLNFSLHFRRCTQDWEFLMAPLPFLALKLSYQWFLKPLWPVDIISTPCQASPDCSHTSSWKWHLVAMSSSPPWVSNFPPWVYSSLQEATAPQNLPYNRCHCKY